MQIIAKQLAAVRRTRRGPSKPPTYTVNGPINISATLYAEPIHAPSSTPRPTLPLRSARPSVIIRPVNVTIPAPRTTPKIPTRGLLEISGGRAPATFLAICTFVGG